MHNGQYQAIQLRTTNNNYGISACYHPAPDGGGIYKLSYGINMHAAGDIKEKTDNPWSAGCLAIADEEYYKFASAAGFVATVTNGEKIDDYNKIKRELSKAFKERETSWGYLVVNREYMDSSEREIVLTNYEERTAN